MKQEDILRKQYGNRNPFRVPEGYFEDFAQRMMEQIPETEQAPAKPQKRISLFTRVKPYVYLAAMFCGLFFGIQVFKYQASHTGNSAATTPAQTAKSVSTDKYVDDVCNYAGIDKEQIYSCVTGNEYE